MKKDIFKIVEVWVWVTNSILSFILYILWMVWLNVMLFVVVFVVGAGMGREVVGEDTTCGC